MHRQGGQPACNALRTSASQPQPAAAITCLRVKMPRPTHSSSPADLMHIAAWRLQVGAARAAGGRACGASGRWRATPRSLTTAPPCSRTTSSLPCMALQRCMQGEAPHEAVPQWRCPSDVSHPTVIAASTHTPSVPLPVPTALAPQRLPQLQDRRPVPAQRVTRDQGAARWGFGGSWVEELEGWLPPA